MNETLDDLYLEWLYEQVASVEEKRPSKKYWDLLRQLYTKEFIWIVPNDDNRVEDGRDLRYEFLEEVGFEVVDEYWMRLSCSVLEMLIALARRCAFEAEGTSQEWFWHLITNLDLLRFHDWCYKKENPEKLIDDRLDRLIFRTYADDGGLGGLFPLQNPREDQRDVEIWYQMSAYLLEHN